MKGHSFLVLGGTGFIGRNLVSLLVSEDSVGHIRVVDKRAWDSEISNCFFSDEHLKAFSSDKVEFVKTDLRTLQGTERAFADNSFDFVVNLADETDDEGTDEDYTMKLYGILKNAVDVAKKCDIKKFIEISSVAVYLSDKKKANTEKSKTSPYTTKAKHKLLAEEYLQASDLPHVIFRVPFVYGPGCTNGLMSRVVVGKVYQALNKKMKMLWKGSLCINTVHVTDVCSAVYCACVAKKVESLFNLCDSGNTTQETMAKILGTIFNIETGYQKEVKNKVARKLIKDAAKAANDKHWEPWKLLLEEQKILNSPLTPFIGKELLKDNPVWVDGTHAEKNIEGFKYKYPQVTTEEIQGMVDYFTKQGVFPK